MVHVPESCLLEIKQADRLIPKCYHSFSCKDLDILPSSQQSFCWSFQDAILTPFLDSLKCRGHLVFGASFRGVSVKITIVRKVPPKLHVKTFPKVPNLLKSVKGCQSYDGRNVFFHTLTCIQTDRQTHTQTARSQYVIIQRMKTYKCVLMKVKEGYFQEKLHKRSCENQTQIYINKRKICLSVCVSVCPRFLTKPLNRF